MLIYFIALAVIVLDQAVKFCVHGSFHLGQSIPVIPGLFHLTYVRNTGAAWGLFSGFGGALIVLSFVMLALLVVFRRHFLTDTLLHRAAAGLMIAGIVGNLADRLKYGFVIDYLDFFVGARHFPAFNVADTAICTGVGIYLLTQFAGGSAAQPSQASAPAAAPAPPSAVP